VFQILSKSLFYILLPVTWIALALLGALFLRNPKWKKRCLISAVLLFFFFTSIPVVNSLLRWYEPEPVVIAGMPVYEYAVVLSGVVNIDMPPRDRVHYHKGADRVLHPAQLYKEGKIKKIIITGGSGRIFTEGRPEADELKKTLLMCGVAEEDILIERESFNTHENAVFTKRMLDSIGVRSKVLLVTSAYHMPRSMGCFKKAGIEFDIFPVDYYQSSWKWTPDFWLIPSERALIGWNILIREWLGYGMYFIMGYI
jgi:uncharacterized SAM-binding protein YcdF (DUF218 family)